MRPAFFEALANYVRWLRGQGRWAEAARQLDESLRIAPIHAGAWNNLGIVSYELGRADAVECYRKALAIDPELPDAHYKLECLLSGHGRSEEAIASHTVAIIADPKFGPARLAVCMAELPILYRSDTQVAARRRRYIVALDHLVRCDAGVVAGAIGRSQPFFLPYQGEDDRALQA